MANLTGEDNEFRMMNTIMKEALIKQLKDHLLTTIDGELNEICADAVVRYLEFQVSTTHDSSKMADIMNFNFVQKVVANHIEKIVVREKS